MSVGEMYVGEMSVGERRGVCRRGLYEGETTEITQNTKNKTQNTKHKTQNKQQRNNDTHNYINKNKKRDKTKVWGIIQKTNNNK